MRHCYYRTSIESFCSFHIIRWLSQISDTSDPSKHIVVLTEIASQYTQERQNNYASTLHVFLLCKSSVFLFLCSYVPVSKGPILCDWLPAPSCASLGYYSHTVTVEQCNQSFNPIWWHSISTSLDAQVSSSWLQQQLTSPAGTAGFKERSYYKFLKYLSLSRRRHF